MSELVDMPLATQIADASVSSDSSGVYKSEARLTNLQFVEAPPGSRKPFAISTTPGLNNLTFQPGGSSDFRGSCVRADGVMFVIRGTAAYYSSGGAWTQVPSGSMANNGPCRMVDADTHIVAVDGTNAVAITTAAITSCSRGNFSDVTYQDGITLFTETGSNSVYASNVDDPTTINSLNFTTADALGGDCVGIISDHREVYVFKDTSIEIYYNSGSSGFPFTRSSPGLIEIGCSQKHSIAKYDKAVFWIGRDRLVYMMRGYQPTAISTPWISQALDALSISDVVYGSAFTLRGIGYYVLSTATLSLVYDIKNGLWHERVPDAASDLGTVISYTEWNTSGGHLVTVVANGSSTRRIYLLDPLLATEDVGLTVIPDRTMTLPQFAVDGNRVFMSEIYLDMSKISAGAGTATLSWRDSSGSSYTTGVTATYSNQRVRWTRLGSFCQRTLRFTFADIAQPFSILGVRARIGLGAS